MFFTASHNGWCRLREINYRQIKEHQSKLPQKSVGPAYLLVLILPDPLCIIAPPPFSDERDRHL